MNREDRRARKTERALRQALSELLCQKPIQEITIDELTRKADIHRATFYTHYKDIYDLYQQTEDEVSSAIREHMHLRPSDSYRDFFVWMVDYLFEHSTYCRMLFGGQANPSFCDRICDMLAERDLDICRIDMKIDQVPEEWKLIATYHINGNFALVKKWIMGEFSCSKEMLIETLSNLDMCLDKTFYD